MIVVIAILGVLALIAIPQISGFRDRAEVAKANADAATIANAANIELASLSSTAAAALSDADLIDAALGMVETNLTAGDVDITRSADDLTVTQVTVNAGESNEGVWPAN